MYLNILSTIGSHRLADGRLLPCSSKNMMSFLFVCMYIQVGHSIFKEGNSVQMKRSGSKLYYYYLLDEAIHKYFHKYINFSLFITYEFSLIIICIIKG